METHTQSNGGESNENIGSKEQIKPVVMVVDDEDSIRVTTEIILEDEGYQIELCASGREAIDKMNKNIEAIILDINMPDMTGFQVFEKIKEKNPYVPIIFHTGNVTGKEDKKGIREKYGPHAYVLKGCDPEQLLDTVASAVESYGYILKNIRFNEELCERNKEIDELNKGLEEKVKKQVKDISDLNQIGIALSVEKDYDKLLSLILSKSMELANCDGGSLYILEEGKESERNLAFKIVRNFSISDMSFNEHLLPVNKSSIAGYAACTGEIINLEDVYNITDSQEYTFNRKFDESFNYRTKTMLVIPMKDNKGNIIGILQLINRKKSRNTKLTSNEIVEAEVVPFDKKSIELVNSLASQAAIYIETSILYKNIKILFDGFVRASVHAIEQRDPTTSGHSERVASMIVGMAEVINKTKEGKYKDINFTNEQIKEIRYAGLLHDFGKVGVRENVLVKEKKLYPLEFVVIKNRFDFIRKSVEYAYCKKKANLKNNKEPDVLRKEIKEIDEKLEEELKKLEGYIEVIKKANEPAFLEEDMINEIKKIADKVYQGYNNEEHQYLTTKELDYLCIRKGTLDPKEREEIESHVTYSYEFLKKIPWTKELERIPDIAYAHHEGLSGRGYPLELKGDEIPFVSKMMTIIDIYDALTAQDRPYKKAVPHERALSIISSEVKNNSLDADLFDLFVNERVYELAKVEAWDV